jgi:uncharacterized membrane protein
MLWKMISLVLFIFLIASFLALALLYSQYQGSQKKIDCFVNVCEGFDRTVFVEDYGVCYCSSFDKQGNIIKNKTMVM